MTSWWKLIAQRAGHTSGKGSWKRRYAVGEDADDDPGHTWVGKQVRQEGATRTQGSWTKRLVEESSIVMGAAARSLYGQEGGVTDEGIVYEGLEEPPVVDHEVVQEGQTIRDEITITGKVKPGFYGKFVYPVDAIVAAHQYKVDFTADLSLLAQAGARAGFGFGLKQGNKFLLALLQGQGAGQTRAAIIRGEPPNGWNKPTGHSETNLGAPTNGNQHGGDIRMVVNAAGTAFDFDTSGNSQSTWDNEADDALFSPFANAAAAEQVGFAGFFHSSDGGEFSVTLIWVAVAADVTAPTLSNPAGGDVP